MTARYRGEDLVEDAVHYPVAALVQPVEPRLLESLVVEMLFEFLWGFAGPFVDLMLNRE